MKIKDIQVDGFGVWSGLTVHSMSDNMTVFYGPNEAGKTTLMQFLRTMFYGFTSERRTRYLPPVNGGKPGGSIRVTGPGGGYEITRRSQLDQNGKTGQLTVTGSDGLAQGQHRLAMLLGQVDETIFTNVFAIGLRELQELSTLDDTAAADELYKLSSGLDRVSLVEVIRQLRVARGEIVGPTPEKGQLQRLLLQREKLKDEIEQLTGHGRRWIELAALRNSQQSELEELKQRIEQWEEEAKAYEVALQIRPNWRKRSEIQTRITELNARTDIPESAADKLQELTSEVAEREAKLDGVKQKRKTLRDRARNLPLRRGILELTSKIEAANEQGPWISSIQKNLQRLEGQVEQTREQLVEDATRLGMNEEDRQALLDDRRVRGLPDLSRQAINQLAEPASEVRMWTTRMKQAKQQSEADKQEAQRLEKELSDSLASKNYNDIHQAMQSHGETVTLLRKRLTVQETLDKQNARREQLETDAVDLAVDEALPVERSFLLGFLFIGGAFLFFWGLKIMLPFLNSSGVEDSQTGLLYVVCGMSLLFFGLMWGNVLDRSTVNDLEDVEDQIDAIRKEIRKTESERDELDRKLPRAEGTIESRLKQAEAEIGSLEALLPLQHNHQAALERHKAARKRAAQAAESLRAARNHWQKTLAQLGLTESLSPKSIRIMADGYESLLQTRRRLQALEEEQESRQLELGAIIQRIDSLSRQAFAAKAASDAIAGDEQGDEFEEQPRPNAPTTERQPNSEPVKAGVDQAKRALDQLAQLTALVSSQEQYIQQKRGMKDEDQQLARQAVSIQKAIDKLHRSHSALLAEHGCESEEQLLELLERKQQHQKLVAEQAEYAERIQSMVGGSVPYETVERLLDGPGADELEKRWEALGQRSQQAEQRVEQLHQRQGELSQEMKSLASNTRLAEAKLELSCVENQIKACSTHWQTLAVTTALLDKVCEVYETERQPETLREASAFLNQLTEGKYVRIWTPLGKNQLRIDNAHGQSLPLEVLSRGTREAVFIALRLSLAAAYARRGVTIPLVLDDVLVNFDAARAESAAKVLKTFAELGHQVMMFTCHEHIMRIFYEIGVQVRRLPDQGQANEAELFHPDMIGYSADTADTDDESSWENEEDPEQPSEAEMDTEARAEPEPIQETEANAELEPVPEAGDKESPAPAEPPSEPVVIELPEREAKRTPKRKRKRDAKLAPEPSEIDWLWYERVPEAEELGWVESDSQSADRPPPEDLWWQRGDAQAAVR